MESQRFVFYFFCLRTKILKFFAYAHCTHLLLTANAQTHPSAKPKEPLFSKRTENNNDIHRQKKLETKEVK